MLGMSPVQGWMIFISHIKNLPLLNVWILIEMGANGNNFTKCKVALDVRNSFWTGKKRSIMLRRMFGLFKRNFSEIDSLKYLMIAVSASGNALGVTQSLFAQSSKKDGATFMALYMETLAFAVCLAQMRIQKRYKVKEDHDVVTIVQELQKQLGELPVIDSTAHGIGVTRKMLDNATTDAFF